MQFFVQGLFLCGQLSCLFWFISGQCCSSFTTLNRCCEYALLILEHWPDASEIHRSAELYEDLIKCCVADAMSEVWILNSTYQLYIWMYTMLLASFNLPSSSHTHRLSVPFCTRNTSFFPFFCNVITLSWKLIRYGQLQEFCTECSQELGQNDPGVCLCPLILLSKGCAVFS